MCRRRYRIIEVTMRFVIECVERGWSVVLVLFNGPATTEIDTYLHTRSIHDAFPISPALLERLQRLFPLEWEEVASDAGDRRAGALREAAADPLFAASPLPPEQLARAALPPPPLAAPLAALPAAYRPAGQRLAIIDDDLTGGPTKDHPQPWAEGSDRQRVGRMG